MGRRRRRRSADGTGERAARGREGRPTCEASASPRILPSPVTTAAPVSSQLVSMPRTTSFSGETERSTGSPARTTSARPCASAKPRLADRAPESGAPFGQSRPSREHADPQMAQWRAFPALRIMLRLVTDTGCRRFRRETARPARGDSGEVRFSPGSQGSSSASEGCCRCGAPARAALGSLARCCSAPPCRRTAGFCVAAPTLHSRRAPARSI